MMESHQPLALAEPDFSWRAACLCGWKDLFTEQDRAAALIRAYGHDRKQDGQ